MQPAGAPQEKPLKPTDAPVLNTLPLCVEVAGGGAAPNILHLVLDLDKSKNKGGGASREIAKTKSTFAR